MALPDAYKTYAAAIAIVAVAVIDIVNFKNNNDLYSNPYARPLAFTSKDGERLRERIDKLEDWRSKFIVDWGTDRGRNEGRHERTNAEILELHRIIERIRRQNANYSGRANDRKAEVSGIPAGQ